MQTLSLTSVNQCNIHYASSYTLTASDVAPNDEELTISGQPASHQYQYEIFKLKDEIDAKIHRDNLLLTNFAQWLTARRLEVEGLINAILLRVQADALTHAMRCADALRRKRINKMKNETHRNSTGSTASKITVSAAAFSQNSSRGSRYGDSNKKKKKSKLQKAIDRAKANMSDAARRLELAASQVNGWHIETRKARCFIHRCSEVERACVVKPYELSVNINPSRRLNLSTIGNRVYFFDQEQAGGNLRSAPIATSVSTHQSQSGNYLLEHFAGDSHCCIKALCYVNQIGLVLLARRYTPNAGNSVEIWVSTSSTSVDFRVAVSLKQYKCSNYDIFSLFTSGDDSFVIMLHREGEIKQFQLQSAFESSAAIDWDAALRQTKEWKVDRRVKAFYWNVKCLHALAVYEQHGVVLSLFMDEKENNWRLRRSATLTNNEEDTHFAQCALSDSGLCVLVLAKCTVRLRFVGVLRIFDLKGTKLRSISDGNATMFNVLIDTQCRLALQESADKKELNLVYAPHSGGGLKKIRLISSRKNFARRCQPIQFAEDNALSPDFDVYSSRKANSLLSSYRSDLLSTTDLLIEQRRMKTPLDFDEAFVSDFAENKSALYFLDTANDQVKRCSKNADGSFGDAQSLCRTSRDVEDDCVTGFCSMNEDSLLLVRGNWQLEQIDAANGQRVHTQRFSKTRLQYLNGHAFVFLVDLNKLVIAIENTAELLTLRSSAPGSADWRIQTTHLLPEAKHLSVGHVNYDSRSRRFVLAVRDSSGAGEERLSLLDENLTEVGTLELPEGYGDVVMCLLGGRICLVGCRSTVYSFRSYELVYDVSKRSVLHVVDNRMFTAIVSRPSEADEKQRSDEEWPFVFIFYGTNGSSLAIQRTSIDLLCRSSDVHSLTSTELS